ncbi:MAG TPA: glycosyltransferase family 87 protein [Polyangiaceae bacterium LLY-WYZ-15_(1-7)]|nr:hypothetical protein [Myxococcales bacterium]MBJ74349.1 hypothetical protein [Sandaracinus sp.]HJL05773.1 glycosyltransferase family 87 protein [Polyangiaceae bacterium LLY-WYZ-15_(1-7)]HJL11618.1 glycosyltransferase family 87 protein [Polyangiaceae bacterium LLY-WYZ-15_(1-7)]
MRLVEGLARFANRQRWPVYYFALAATCFFSIIVPKAVGPWDGLYDHTGTALGADFVAFYAGGTMVRRGEASELYDVYEEIELQYAIVGEDPEGGGAFFLNPPPYALLMVPIAALPYVPAVALWWVLGLALLVASTLHVVRAVNPDAAAPIRPRHALLFALGFVPTQIAFAIGQNTFLSLALSAFAFVALRSGREVLGGALVGAMILKPQLALGFALVLVVKRRWKAVTAAAVVTLSLIGLSVALIPEAWPGFLASVRGTAQLVRGLEHDFPAFLGLSVPGALSLLADWALPRVVDFVGPLLGIGILVALGMYWHRRPWTPGSRSWDVAMGATLAAGWLASPHLLLYDAALFLLPAWLLYMRVGRGPAGRPFGGGRLYGWTLLALLGVSLWIQLVSGYLWEHLPEWGLPRVVPQLVTVALAGWTLAMFREAAALEGAEGEPRADDGGAGTDGAGAEDADAGADEDAEAPVPV